MEDEKEADAVPPLASQPKAKKKKKSKKGGKRHTEPVKKKKKKPKLKLDGLPLEILSHIFGYIDAKNLYPNCYLINSLCLSAVLTDSVWRQRCKRDLDVTKQCEGMTWRETYRGTLLL